jgi:flagellar basal-body rod modification protein FlgD
MTSITATSQSAAASSGVYQGPGANANNNGSNTTATTSSATSTTQTAAQSQQQLSGNMNTFLQLLTAQLQHQDPLSPMDTAQFTNQLVEFSSVEQEININANLEKMLASTNSTEMASAVGYIGETVQGVSSSLPLQNGSASFAYTTPANTSTVNIVISDSAGNVVQAMTGNAAAGTHTATWNGQDSYGNQLQDGTYSLTVTAVGSDNSQTPLDTAVSGKVTGVGMDASNNVQLYMNGVDLPLSQVILVQAPASSSSSSAATTNTNTSAGTN